MSAPGRNPLVPAEPDPGFEALLKTAALSVGAHPDDLTEIVERYTRGEGEGSVARRLAAIIADIASRRRPPDAALH